MSLECFVPKCKSTIGVPFPRDRNVRRKWLDGLNISNLTPKTGSFVCFSHFKSSDLNDENVAGTRPSNRIKRGAVPCISKPKETVKNESENICRACTSTKNVEKDISDEIEDGITVTEALTLCAFPIEISKSDNFPKKICRQCLGMLKIAHKFRAMCLETDDLLRDRLKEKGAVSQKRKNASDDESEGKAKSIRRANKSPSTIAEKNVDGSMQKVHDTSTNEHFFLEDDSTSENSDVNTVNFEISETSRPSRQTVEKCKEPERKLIFRANIQQETPTLLSNKTKLPKDVPVKVVQAYESKTGTFSSVFCCGLYGNVFVKADDYLFELGLLKRNVRQVKCLVPSCRAFGLQKLLENGDFESIVVVKVPHNHPAPTEQIRKKQMFFHVMRKKMQTDKMLNIRNMYEDVCLNDPEIRTLVPLRNVINEICRHQLTHKLQPINSFEQFFKVIETDAYEKLHFTHSSKQFYQEKFACDDESMAIIFANCETVGQFSNSDTMYVDASFRIDTNEEFKYQLVTVLVWTDDSYYPILFAVVNKKSRDIFKSVFQHLHDVLAPDLRPKEIITDYEATLYYALGETYVESHLAGSVFYYTQNLYKKICSLNLSRDLETNSLFRNIYHMLLMLPLLPVNTILDGLNNIEVQARDINMSEMVRPIFDHVRTQWIINVTPALFCAHRLENRINENVIAPFKKLRDFLLLTKGKAQKTHITITHVIEKIIELEAFLHEVYAKPDKKAFGRDLSSFQKRNVLRAWHYIECHPKIDISNFFTKVLGYIKCMENQLWIWGFYRYVGDTDDVLINASNFSIINVAPELEAVDDEGDEDDVLDSTDVFGHNADGTVVYDALIEQDGGVVIQNAQSRESDEQTCSQFESAFRKYILYQ